MGCVVLRNPLDAFFFGWSSGRMNDAVGEVD